MAAKAGQVLGERYKLLRPIGQGAQASVWIAEHLALGSQVAVKLIDPELAKQDDARERFRREATAAAQLRSAHVVQILDHGIDEGQPFIVMELLEGEDLFQRLERRERLSVEETSAIVTQIARALARAHAGGIIHRDLKPENVFLVPNEDDEIAKVLDFGVAKIQDPEDSASRTSVGTLIGTPHYMSPEQVRGVGDIDHRSDLWSLGIIAFQCAVGDLPFESDGVGDLLIKISTERIPVPSEAEPSLPPEFDAWFAKACARDPADRFQSARELAASLAQAAGLIPASKKRSLFHDIDIDVDVELDDVPAVLKTQRPPPGLALSDDDDEPKRHRIPAAPRAPRLGAITGRSLPRPGRASAPDEAEAAPKRESLVSVTNEAPKRSALASVRPPAAPSPAAAKPAAVSPAAPSPPLRSRPVVKSSVKSVTRSGAAAAVRAKVEQPPASARRPVEAATEDLDDAWGAQEPAEEEVLELSAEEALSAPPPPIEDEPDAEQGAPVKPAPPRKPPLPAAAAKHAEPPSSEPEKADPPEAASAEGAPEAAEPSREGAAAPGPAPAPESEGSAAAGPDLVPAPPPSRPTPPKPKPSSPVAAPAPRPVQPRQPVRLETVTGVSSEDIEAPPELDGSRRKRTLRVVAVLFAIGAVAVVIGVIQSHAVAPSSSPAVADPAPAREPERLPPPPVEPSTDPSAEATAAPSGSASAEPGGAINPGQSQRPVRDQPKAAPAPAPAPRPGGGGGPRPRNDDDIVIEIPLPDREVPR